MAVQHFSGRRAAFSAANYVAVLAHRHQYEPAVYNWLLQHFKLAGHCSSLPAADSAVQHFGGRRSTISAADVYLRKQIIEHRSRRFYSVARTIPNGVWHCQKAPAMMAGQNQQKHSSITTGLSDNGGELLDNSSKPLNGRGELLDGLGRHSRQQRPPPRMPAGRLSR